MSDSMAGMWYINAPAIVGTGSFLPPYLLANETIEASVEGTNAEWTQSTLGIHERRIAHDLTTTDMAYYACIQALRRAELKPGHIQALIMATTTPHQASPASACFLQERLGTNGPAFDISAACAGFVYALIMASQMLMSSDMDYILVVASDAYSTVTDWDKRNCVFFGDGAGAVVVTKASQLFAYSYGCEGSGAEAWYIRDGKWNMDPAWVFSLAVRGIVRSAQEVLGTCMLSPSHVDIVIPHQPGIRVLEAAAEQLSIPFSKFHLTMDRFANTASASVPITLHDAIFWEKIKRGDFVLLTTVGAGWIWASCLLKWT